MTCEGLHMYVLLFCRQYPGRFLLDSLHERGFCGSGAKEQARTWILLQSVFT